MPRVMIPKDKSSLVVSKFTAVQTVGGRGLFSALYKRSPSVSYKCSPALFHAYTLSCLLYPLEIRGDHIHLWYLLSSTAPSAAVCKSKDSENFL